MNYQKSGGVKNSDGTLKYNYKIISHFSGADVYAVVTKHYNIRGEYNTVEEAKMHIERLRFY